MTFGENNIIEIEKRGDNTEKEDKENSKTIGQIREDRQQDGKYYLMNFFNTFSFSR